MIARVVSPLINNYPLIIELCGDNLNVGTCSDPSSLVSQAIPIPFRSTDRFQYRHVEEGSGDLHVGPLYVDLYGSLNRVNGIAEHIIRADFVT